MPPAGKAGKYRSPARLPLFLSGSPFWRKGSASVLQNKKFRTGKLKPPSRVFRKTALFKKEEQPEIIVDKAGDGKIAAVNYPRGVFKDIPVYQREI